MGRRKKSITRKIALDSVYNSEIISKFINKVMLKGKKVIAERIVFSALKKAEEKLGQDGKQDGKDIFTKALENSKPLVDVRSKRVGGATYQVPVEVRNNRQTSVAMTWLVKMSRARSEYLMSSRLGNEIIDAYNNTGKTIKKREEVHKMAESNKAFSYFKW